MKASKVRIIAAILVLALVFGLCGCGKRKSDDPVEDAALSAVDWLYGDVGAVHGANWLAVAMSAWEGLAPKDNWQEGFGDSVAAVAEECGGVFSAKKLTDQAKVVISVTAAGYDAADFAGYDLTLPFADYETALLQGINGASWSLIALDFGGYDMPENPDAAVQATKDMYIDYILSRQLPDGGFAFSTTATLGDPDMTGMVLIALANYMDRADVAEAVERAVTCLSELQDEDGGYTSYGFATAESCAQVILALLRLGIPLDDERFIKNGNTIMDKLLEYRTDDGGFAHVMGDAVNGVATEQAMIAVVSYLRIEAGMPDIFTAYR
ncbi:MAG: terpene cyclase/mutase family protein [Oscillospiraceae bacterium]|nr:terpene cyclase/mutase family protein [Oscillospiraceae bacterium]